MHEEDDSFAFVGVAWGPPERSQGDCLAKLLDGQLDWVPFTHDLFRFGFWDIQIKSCLAL
jgi:hypothetical protein